MMAGKQRMSNGETFVTWKQLLTTLIMITSINVTSFWALMQGHSAHPHDGAVHEDHFLSSIKTLNKSIDSLEKQIDTANREAIDILKQIIDKLP